MEEVILCDCKLDPCEHCDIGDCQSCDSCQIGWLVAVVESLAWDSFENK